MAEAEFLFLRPYCIQLLERPSRSNVKALQNALCNVEPGALQTLQEFVMVPLMELLKTTDRTQEIVVDIVNCLKTIVSCTQIQSWNLFSDLVFQIVRLIGNPSRGSESPLANVSDELKQSVIGCLQELIVRSTSGVLERVYDEEYLPRLGHIVYLLLYVAENDIARETRLLAMKCLRTLGRWNDSDSLKQKSLDCLRTFVPGISVILTKVATESGLAGQAIVTSALQTWSDFIFNIFHDELPCSAVTVGESNADEHKDKRLFRMPTRNSQWLRASSEKLLSLTSKISVLVSHSRWQVRLAVAQWANGLLMKCKRTLVDSVPICVDVLITLSSDDYSSVGEFASRSVENFSKTLSPDERSLVETLQENLLRLSVRLPSVLRNSDDAKKLSILDQLYGYLNILGTSLDVVLMSATHLDKLSFSLLQLTELDCSDIQLISESSANSNPVDDLVTNPPPKPRRKFLHFDEERIYDRILKICQTLGKHGDLQLLSDHFMDRFYESSLYRKQAVLLLNEIIVGKATTVHGTMVEVLYPTICYVVGEYMEPGVWDLKVWDGEGCDDLTKDTRPQQFLVMGQSDRNEVYSLSTLRSNATLTSLLLEGLGSCARVLGMEFRPLLMKVLYNVMEKLGSPNALVSHSAYFALLQIASSCNYSSISDVILRNADYLLDCLSIKLRYKPLDLKGPTVFRVALQHGDRRMLDLAQDIVQELFNNLDAHHGQILTAYLRVLHSLVNAINKWFPPRQPVKNSPTTTVEKETSVYEFILEYHRLKQLSDEALRNEIDTIPEDLSCNDGIPQPFAKEPVTDCEAEEGPKQKPVYVRMTVDVLERCGHLLPAKSSLQSLLVLEITDVSVRVLQDWQDDLLPMVHKIWSPLVHRFSSENLTVMKKAFEVLCTLSRVCGDFVQQRFVKEIWPKTLSFLEKQKSLSENKEDAVYRYTSSYKLLLDTLNNAGELAELLRVPDVDLDDLASVAVGYLSSRQPVVVQTVAVRLFEQLWRLDPDLVWLKLKDLYSECSTLSASDHRLPTVQVGGHYPNNVEFRSNVTRLLNASSDERFES